MDWSYSEEKIDQYDVYLYARQAHGPGAGHAPDLPPGDPRTRGVGGPPGLAEAVLDELPEYVESLSPGVLKEVESPHYMEPVVPERIARKTEMLIDRIPNRGRA